MAENGAVVRKRAINHIRRALHESGFFPNVKKAERGKTIASNLELTGVVDDIFCKACEIFLQAQKGRDVERVINAFRSTKTSLFKNIPSGNVVTSDVRMATWMFVATHLAESVQKNNERVVIAMAS